MTEAQFTSWLVELAQRFCWRVYHVPFPARQVGGGRLVPEKRAAGFPDLVLVRVYEGTLYNPRLIFAELKGEKGRFSADQDAWLGDLREVGSYLCIGQSRWNVLAVYRWRPSDRDEIEKVLR